MKYLLAHDLGTSGDKATLFSVEGELIGSRTVPYQTYYDAPRQAEQDAESWWNAVCGSTKALLAAYGVSGEDVAAVSFSGQMMGCLPVDESGAPLRRAIIWADTRAEKETALLGDQIELRRFYQYNGHRNAPSYGIQKAMWVKANEPEIYERTFRFLNAKDYVVHQLTGEFCTDHSDANSMTAYDQEHRCWAEEIVEASGISMEKLPEIRESTDCIGCVTPEAAAATGLSTRTKVIMGAGDGVAANVGAGCTMPGSAYCCLGTSAWVASTSEEPVLDEDMRIVCWAHAVPGLYSPNGTMQYAGGSYRWLQETICLQEAQEAKTQGISVYDVMNRKIESCAPGADGVLFLPYLMGERAPRWNPDAKGVFFGITQSTSREQIIRSVMEGIIMNLGICFDILQKEVPIQEITLIGGPARSGQWQRCIADVFDTKVRVPELLEESGSMGAAIIAGVGAGIYPDFSVADKFIQIRETRSADPDTAQLYKEQKARFDALYEALLPVYR